MRQVRSQDLKRMEHSGRSARAGAWLGAAVAAVLLAGCGSAPPRGDGVPVGDAGFRPAPGAATTAQAGSAPRPGAYYQDDGPGDSIPPGLEFLPDAFPRVETYSRTANRPYVVFGQEYKPDLSDVPFTQRGMGSWYGRKFHGQRTSSGEIYDMYRMTAAHPTLPIPSYALVTNTVNGRSVIVRINDRGPFLRERIIDLSFAAAYKLGYAMAGSAPLEVARILPVDIAAGRIPLTTTTLARSAPGADSAAALPPQAQARAPEAGAAAVVPVVATRADLNAVAVAAPVTSAEPVVATPLAAAPVAPAAPAAPVAVAAPSAPVVRTAPLVAAPVAPLAPAAPAAASVAPPSAAVAAAPPVAASAAATSVEGVDAPIIGAYVLQLGAFKTVPGAEALRAQLIGRLASLKGKLRIVPGDDFYRVQIGPYPDRRAAVNAAEAMAPALRFTPLVVQRR